MWMLKPELARGKLDFIHDFYFVETLENNLFYKHKLNIIQDLTKFLFQYFHTNPSINLKSDPQLLVEIQSLHFEEGVIPLILILVILFSRKN